MNIKFTEIEGTQQPPKKRRRRRLQDETGRIYVTRSTTKSLESPDVIVPNNGVDETNCGDGLVNDPECSIEATAADNIPTVTTNEQVHFFFVFFFLT